MHLKSLEWEAEGRASGHWPQVLSPLGTPAIHVAILLPSSINWINCYLNEPQIFPWVLPSPQGYSVGPLFPYFKVSLLLPHPFLMSVLFAFVLHPSSQSSGSLHPNLSLPGSNCHLPRFHLTHQPLSLSPSPSSWFSFWNCRFLILVFIKLAWL